MSGIGAKLVAVAIRQVAKPISLTIKAQAIQHPSFRKACIFIAQRLHRVDIRLRMSLLGQKNTKVRPLNDRKAIEDGATFLAETFVFGVAGSIIVYEAYRARRKQNERTEVIEDDIRALQDEIEYIRRKLNEHNVKLDDYKMPKELRPKILKLQEGEAANETSEAELSKKPSHAKSEEKKDKKGNEKKDEKLWGEIESLEKKYEEIKRVNGSSNGSNNSSSGDGIVVSMENSTGDRSEKNH